MNVMQNNNGYGVNLTKQECIDDLKNSYNTPGHPIAFSGVNNIYQYYRQILSRREIQNVLSGIENYTLHREFHKGQRNPSYSHFKRYQFQCDLVDVQSLSDQNDGVRFLLTCIDTFTRFAFVRLLKSKHGPVVVEAFKSILQEAVDPPSMVVLDRGTEFYNQHFKNFCQTRNIMLFSPDSSIHGAFVERFNRTLQSIVYKYMTENETRRYIDRTNADGTRTMLMPLFVQTYNNRKHRMIGRSPSEAETDPSTHGEIRKKLSAYYLQVKKTKPKFEVGDYVRISKLSGKFDRGYNQRAQNEIFKVHEISTKLPKPMYTLSNYDGTEIIKGKFYDFEITKFSGDVFRVEKVIKKRKYRGRNQLFVKWKGFPDRYNSWIDADQVVQRF